MANPDGNPDIAKIGEATRIGGPNRPDSADAQRKGGEMKNGIRTKLRKLACHEVELDLETGSAPTIADIAKAWGKEAKDGKIKLNMAEVWALQKSKQAMSDGKAMDKLIEHVDGKQIERKVEASVTLADIINGTFEGADDGDGE